MFFKSLDQYYVIYIVCVRTCACVLTHLGLCSEISCDKVGGKQPDSLVCFPFPPVWVTEMERTMFRNKQKVKSRQTCFYFAQS